MSRERPLPCLGHEVRAILAGTKTQTRRRAKIDDVANGKPVQWVSVAPCTTGIMEVRCPYGEPGDRLWVRETHIDLGACFLYRADADAEQERAIAAPGQRWAPSIHMPRAASRLTLEITGVRVERLQEISEADAVAEGCKADPFPGPWWQGYRDIGNGDVIHQQAIGETPPSWMIEPKRMPHKPHLDRSAVDAYRALWMQINGPGSWDANPLVWVLEFRKLERQ